jgi:predicted RNA binding protein YcfA (HicA-like mRNA interferase family)
MGNREKRLQRIRQNPTQVAYNDLVLALLDHGFVERNPKSAGSHRVFTRGAYIITVPYRRPHVLEVYVKRVLRILDEIDEDERA